VLSKVPIAISSRYRNFKNVALWTLLRGFVNTSDWPLCSCAQKCLNLKEFWKWEHLKAGVYQRTVLLSNAPVCICVSTLWRASLMSIYNMYNEVLIVVANHRHIWWACEHKGQSEAFTNPLNSTQCVILLKLLTTLPQLIVTKKSPQDTIQISQFSIPISPSQKNIILA